MSEVSSSAGLAPPAHGAVDLLVIAAEHSGDEHAARVVQGVLAAQPGLKIGRAHV